MQEVFMRDPNYKKYVMNKMFIFRSDDEGIYQEFIKIFNKIKLHHVKWSEMWLDKKEESLVN